MSESFQAVTGYTGDEFDGLFGNVEKFVHPEDIVPLREAFALGRKRMSRLRVDFRLKTKQRGYRWFSARARYSTNPDDSIRISGSLQDINFIKAAEEALRAGRDRAREANKAKSYCKDNVCPNLPEVVDARNVSIANGNVSTVGFVIGGVGVAAGVILALTVGRGSPEKPKDKKEAFHVQPYVGVGSAGFVGTF